MWKNVGHVARLHNVSRQTIGRWVREGKFERVEQTESGHYRIWVPSEVEIFLYARVDAEAQRGELDLQQTALQTLYPDGKPVSDVASGQDFDRRGFGAILERALNGSPCIVVATARDRVATAGFRTAERLIQLSGGEIRLLEADEERDEFDAKSFVRFVSGFAASDRGKRAARLRGLLGDEEDQALSRAD